MSKGITETTYTVQNVTNYVQISGHGEFIHVRNSILFSPFQPSEERQKEFGAEVKARFVDYEFDETMIDKKGGFYQMYVTGNRRKANP